MTDFLENLLDSMSSAFNSSPTPADGASVIDLNLSEDKTLKWRGLHNNQYARKNSKKATEVAVKEEKSIQGQDGASSPQADKDKTSSGSVNDVVVDDKEEKVQDGKQSVVKNQKKQQETAEGSTRRLRRSRAELTGAYNAKLKFEDKPPPLKRRGRSKKSVEDQETTASSSEANEPTQKSDDLDNASPRKLRRSERNTSVENKVDDDTIGSIPKLDEGLQKVDPPEGKSDTSEGKLRKIRRSIRLETKADTEDGGSKAITPTIPDIEIKDDSPPEQINHELNGLVEKQILNEKTPKKRGRRSKVATYEKSNNSESKKAQKLSKDSTESTALNDNVRKEKVSELVSTPSQRPLRRIKPTVKILENEELRYEFETKNIARMTACVESHIENNNIKNKKVEKEENNENREVSTASDAVKKKISDNLNVDNIYPKSMQKPCPDPQAFLNEIKAAKINLHKSPEDKKLNRKQHRKLLKQKEKHFEKLGLRKNVKEDLSDSLDSPSDNEEFIPSKKVNVGKTNVTLRIRNNKENSTMPKEVQRTAQRKRVNSKVASMHPVKMTASKNSVLEEIIKDESHIMLCLCQKPSQYYTRYTPETSFCCAIDNIEEQKVGCCNQLTGDLLNLLRPSFRVGYMILCEDHKKRLRAHNCCAGCGMFCTQGKFMLCPQKHFFHPYCAQKFILNTPYDPTKVKNYPSPTLVLKCPHCGVDTPEKTSMITMKCQTLPVFLPSQKSLIRPAKMSVPDGHLPMQPKRKPQICVELDKLIPESVMNVVVRENVGQIGEFTSKDLFYSINNDDLERVAEIISSGYDITSEMPEFLNGTCLHFVAHFGTIQMAYLLLCRENSEDFLNLFDKELRTAAMCAIIGDKLDILKLFIECGADLGIKGPDGMTCLHIAAKHGSLQAAKLIVESFKTSNNITSFLKFLNLSDDGGWTAMVWAAGDGYTDIVSLLLNHGADPNICDSENNTVLHWATLSNHIETILVLLRANVDCNTQNINGDTPLHIACRQSSTRVCLMLIANGADLMVKNKVGELPYDCIPDEESQCARAVGFNMQMRSFGPMGLRNKIACSDISNGKEAHPIQVVKCDRREISNMDFVDDSLLPDFKYITKSILFQNSIQIDYRVSQMRICSCNDGCNSNQCQCSTISVQNWYTPEGRLSGEFNYEDPPMIFECNDVCGCNKLMCKNRVVQNGIKIPLQVFECEERTKGWGVRSLIQIPKGSFIAEYTGEILTDLEADRRTDDSFFFDLGASEHCIDANYYGNISRFFNHSCSPNIVPVRVYFEHQDYRFPKIAFFACKDIPAGEELTFDYGDKFWAVKQKYFTCKCHSQDCRYSTLISRDTSTTVT